MATNKSRRDTERQRLQRQLDERRQREVARKRFTLIASIVGTLVVIAAVVVGIVVATGDDPKPKNDAAASDDRCAAVAGLSGAVTFSGVSVGNAANLKKEPKVCSAGTADPTKLMVKDLVVGKGKTPSLTSNVSVQYTGVLYKKGTQFDSSWARGMAADFSLQGVVPGFTQGIGGDQKTVKPMQVGGRRIVIMPSALGYGATGSGSTIPPNTSLVFVIDLVKVSS